MPLRVPLMSARGPSVGPRSRDAIVAAAAGAARKRRGPWGPPAPPAPDACAPGQFVFRTSKEPGIAILDALTFG